MSAHSNIAAGLLVFKLMGRMSVFTTECFLNIACSFFKQYVTQ